MKRNLYGPPLAGLLRERKLAEVLFGEVRAEYQDVNAHICIEHVAYFFQVAWMISKWWEEG